MSHWTCSSTEHHLRRVLRELISELPISISCLGLLRASIPTLRLQRFLLATASFFLRAYYVATATLKSKMYSSKRTCGSRMCITLQKCWQKSRSVDSYISCSLFKDFLP